MKKLTSILLIVLVACAEPSEEPRLMYAKILVDVRERLDTQPRSIFLHLSTETIYTCLHPLSSEMQTKNNGYAIVVLGVVKPGNICLTEIAPAEDLYQLNASPGRYDLQLKFYSSFTRGILEIGGDEIKMMIPSSRHYEVVKPVTRRIPANTYWGMIGNYYPESDQFTDNFIAGLIEKGVQLGKQIPGEYTEYTINESGEIELFRNAHHFERNYRTFVFTHPGTENEVKQMMHSLMAEFPEDVNLYVMTSSGNHITTPR